MTPAFENADIIFHNCHIATMADNAVSPVTDAALAVKDKKLTWIGTTADLFENHLQRAGKIIDCRGQWILPGFVDCHTHLVWGGSRSDEFEMRLNGVSYQEIAAKGGGITATVNATRNATEDQLFKVALKRLNTLVEHGATTVEIKSGYGLDLDTELRMLTVADRLSKTLPVCISPTFLGAHTFPPEYRDNHDGYVDLLINTMLPEVKNQGIAHAVDAFCESIAFSYDQTKSILERAVELGFNIKLHAEQLSDSSGSQLAAELGALSCDHLEYLSQDGAKAMAENNVTAVLLPGAFYYLKETRKPPVRLFRELNIPMAVSTDLNPGSSPVYSMPLVLNMSCMLFGLTVEEALLGATVSGAKALKLDHKKGSLEKGKDADLAVWDIDRPGDLCYMTGTAPASLVMANGSILTNRL